MNSNTTNSTGKSASRWWRLDPLIAAHLRSGGRPAATDAAPSEVVARVKRWSVEADAAAWADTDWSDTRVDSSFD